MSWFDSLKRHRTGTSVTLPVCGVIRILLSGVVFQVPITLARVGDATVGVAVERLSVDLERKELLIRIPSASSP